MKTAKIVVGANLGDEGKGTVVAHYAKLSKDKPTLNILTNGGAQRAHSVVSDNGAFTFQHFGSGSCYNADNYFSQFFILNPMRFSDELKSLEEKIDIGRIYRHPNCRWSTPFDQMFNLAIEANRGKDRHGSCGMGIWETVLRYSKSHQISFDEFIGMDDEHKKCYLKNVKSYFDNRKIQLPKELIEPWNSDGLIEHFIADCKFLYSRTYVADAKKLSAKYDDFIFENGQGLLLNDDPNNVHTTPSNTGIDDSIKLVRDFGILPENTTVHYVTRPYMTRHGSGFLESEKKSRKEISSSIQEDRTNHCNESQGEFRYGCLDILDLKHRIDQDFSKVKRYSKILEITHCDEMDRIEEFKQHFANIHTFESSRV